MMGIRNSILTLGKNSLKVVLRDYLKKQTTSLNIWNTRYTNAKYLLVDKDAQGKKNEVRKG